MTDALSPFDGSVITVGLVYDWAEEFRSFTPQHVLTLAVCLAAIAAACALGHRWRGTLREKRLRFWWVMSLFVFQVYANFWFLVLHYDPTESWPLHICDLVVWVAGFALLLQHRWLRTVLYFWGIGLSTQAFFTPVCEVGWMHPKFWFFWVGHTQIIGAAVYDVIVLRYRPRWRDFLFGMAFSVGYALAVTPINLAFDLNYGYIGRILPARKTILNELPDWPVRPFVVAAIAAVILFIAYAAWPVAGWMKRWSETARQRDRG